MLSNIRIIADRYLLDKEITDWSVYLLEYNVSGVYSIKQINNYYDSYLSIEIDEHINSKIEYRLSFSILSDKVDLYYKILENLKITGIPKNILFLSGKKSKFNINNDILNISVYNFEILDKKYTTLDYLFVGNIVDVIPYVTIIKDSIEYLKCFKDIILKIGDIVSPIRDKSNNLLITNYIFSKVDSKYFLYYDTVELLNIDGCVLSHGSKYVYRYDEVCISRDSKINSILKN